MTRAAALAAALLLGASLSAGAAPETIRFAIMRNGEQIGTHTIEINRGAHETTVTSATELVVKVLFVTAYHLQQTGSERWVNGRLVALATQTDDNGTLHKVSVALKPAGLEVEADGKTSTVDKSMMPATLWNPEMMKRTSVLDPQDGQVVAIEVTDVGAEELTLDAHTVKARHFSIKGKFTQDVWYDEHGRLVQSSLVAPDNSIILYKPQ
ncbi:MAG TPA: DUF6134 family protein [Xanthobacteraceae bacterium]|nr:DUF6134 family protein [Xanthobacteraceae bacterium]